jgi:flagellar basal-body rod protein FlgG
MISQIHMAKTGMIAMQKQLQVISNNISNAQTVGYKSRRMEYEALFPLTFERAITEFDETRGAGKKRRRVMEYGQGVRISDISKNFAQGAIEITNQPLDMAIAGKGMLQFRLPDGSIAYSRAGNLHQDRDGTVVNANGHPLEPTIRIPQGTNDLLVNEEGRVFVQMGDNKTPQEIGQLNLAYFQNPAGLRELGQNLYANTDASGDPRLENPGRNGMGTIQQKALEFSNVNIIDEMMSMVIVQRVFDLAAKAVQASDYILKKGGNLS